MGGVKGTRYLLKIRNTAPHTAHHRKPKTVSPRFSSKRRGTTKRLENIRHTKVKTDTKGKISLGRKMANSLMDTGFRGVSGVKHPKMGLYDKLSWP